MGLASYFTSYTKGRGRKSFMSIARDRSILDLAAGR